MTDRIRAAFRDQAEACRALGSPFTARLLRGLAEALQPGTPVADRVLGWTGDPSSRGDALALRLAGGLHLLARAGRAGLAAVYPPCSVDDATLSRAVLRALPQEAEFLLRWLDSPPQTNEVRRSAALIAVGHWLHARFGKPLVLSELGASAGLNLLWNHYCLRIGPQDFGPPGAVLLAPEWRGPPPPLAAPRIGARAGVDLAPVDPVADRARLLAYVWPDQADRIARTLQALDLAAKLRPQVSRGDAIDWLGTRLAEPHPGAVHLVFHTVAWQYFPTAVQATGEEMFDAAGARATPQAPLARLAMEADGQSPGAALTLILWQGDKQTINLGRIDFHGRWVDWRAPAPH